MILAAGAGTRFGPGGQKLLTEWRGRPLLAHVLARVTEARSAGLIGECLVTHAPGAGGIRELARSAGCRPVAVAAAASGLGASLAAGVAALPPGDAVLIFLGDQPLVGIDTVRRLASASDPSHALVRPRYRSAPDAPGHPVLLGREHWPLAREAAGDRGLDPVLAARGLRWQTVDVPGRNPDVDTPDDLHALDPTDDASLL